MIHRVDSGFECTDVKQTRCVYTRQNNSRLLSVVQRKLALLLCGLLLVSTHYVQVTNQIRVIHIISHSSDASPWTYFKTKVALKLNHHLPGIHYHHPALQIDIAPNPGPYTTDSKDLGWDTVRTDVLEEHAVSIVRLVVVNMKMRQGL